jgi:hypothetical protein
MKKFLLALIFILTFAQIYGQYPGKGLSFY